MDMMRRHRRTKFGIIQVAYIMKPLDDFLEGLDRYGNLTVDDEGVPVTFDHASDEYYDTLPAARGFVEFFQMWERRTRKSLMLGPLTSLINDVEQGIPLKQEWITEAKQAVDRMRKALRTMTTAEAADLTQSARIKFEFDKRRAQGTL